MTELTAAQPGRLPVPIPRDETLFYGEAASMDEGEHIIRHYLRVFNKYRWTILGAVAACLAVALTITMLLPKEFTAVTRIQVDRQPPKIVEMDQVDQEQSGANSLEFYQTQYALLKSRSLSEQVVRDLNLENDPQFLFGHGTANKDEAALPLAKRMEMAADKLNRSTNVNPVRSSSIIDIGYQAKDPALAARVANSIAQNFIESNLARRFQSAAYARQFLQQKLDQTRAKLEQSERRVVAYSQSQGLVNIRSGTADNPTQQSLVSSQLSELSTQLTTARAARIQAEAQYRADRSGAAAAQSLTSTTVNDLRSQRSELVGQLSKLRSDFGPKYAPVVALRAQIAELDRQIGLEQSRVSSSVGEDLRGRFEQALATERELQSKVDALKSELLGEQGKSIEYNILQRDVDTNRALYDALLQRFKEVGVAGGVGTNNVSIVDPAVPPNHASSPNLLLNLALALVFGIVLGAGAAIILDQLAESVILPSEFQRKLQIPLLGSTPISSGLGQPGLLTYAGPEEPSSGSDTREGRSELEEAYFSILTSVKFSTPDGSPKSIAITSSQPKEGKSTTAIELARGLAATGMRVLLIDADMRNPSLHRIHHRGRGKGLSDVLTGNAALEDVASATDVPGVSLVTSGRTPPNPAELLAGRALPRLIKTALEKFDHVIFDSPPVLGLADAPLISHVAHGTIFIIEAGRTRASEARHALDRLAAVRAPIVGAVLTKLDGEKMGYGYGYGYTYKYGGTK